jgi:hypothetical protein
MGKLPYNQIKRDSRIEIHVGKLAIKDEELKPSSQQLSNIEAHALVRIW